jgi:alpha-1,3-rhamnosyl/mannosyltransferase
MADTKIPIILVGWQGWGDKEWMRPINDHKLDGRVFFAGHVHDETLACLYTGAAAFVFPSLYEGFGLPILEAMACGCPVICSKAASLPEVAGKAALQVDPTDAEGLAHALEIVLTDSELRQTMIQQGIERAKQFSWQETAVKTLEVFNQVAGRKAGRL